MVYFEFLYIKKGLVGYRKEGEGDPVAVLSKSLLLPFISLALQHLGEQGQVIGVPVLDVCLPRGVEPDVLLASPEPKDVDVLAVVPKGNSSLAKGAASDYLNRVKGAGAVGNDDEERIVGRGNAQQAKAIDRRLIADDQPWAEVPVEVHTTREQCR